jgi:hypothetical protein
MVARCLPDAVLVVGISPCQPTAAQIEAVASA